MWTSKKSQQEAEAAVAREARELIPAPKLSVKRIAPGFYRYTTPEGIVFEIHGFQRPERTDYGPAGEWRWYWIPEDGDAHDHYDTKHEAYCALVDWLTSASQSSHSTHP